MRRKTFPKRDGYEQSLDRIGFQYHRVLSPDNETYWGEGTAYEFTLDEIEAIETATATLHQMCLETVDEIVASGDYPEEFRLSDLSKTLIENSWRAGDFHVYGRFDLLFDGENRIKMYEYNADTPTSLLEAAVAQWEWVEEAEGVPHRDQFNSLHDKLIARWSEAREGIEEPRLYVVASKFGPYEDWGNVEYMADAAAQAGWEIRLDEIENVGFNYETREFIDLEGNPIERIFKLYPWEWMTEEEFGGCVAESPTKWFEPPWKALLSNKAILPVLWRKFPSHPLLLPAYFENDKPNSYFYNGFVKKPILGREGANVKMAGTFSDALLEGSREAPEYDDKGYVYQEYAPLPQFDGRRALVGSWVVGDEPAGIGIREDKALVTGNGSRFVPHYFVD